MQEAKGRINNQFLITGFSLMPQDLVDGKILPNHDHNNPLLSRQKCLRIVSLWSLVLSRLYGSLLSPEVLTSN
ncbi:hypothetical protein MYAER_3750 [Microcystis aeruginosa NIES-2549]|uniref:Uncharacterized protein n=1 Tax=Microcystis aeruginosa NIES-2549 TaxID=1641812 RepID=A0A0F6U6V1_MICAE|nr:hypothetical protein MYAER_3750 [Microcystis aeruginosa NIES-2549]AOC54493.1 hypothetical protein amyaer_3798 [Microcystis aeruginosa NIES-2481]